MYPGKPSIALLALVILAIAFAGCSSPSPTTVATATPTPAPTPVPTSAPATSPTPAPETAAVTIKDFAFNPQVVKIAAGGSVTWTNDDSAAHTVKFSDSESSTLSKGATYTKKFDAPGTYTYHCGIHTYMTGTVEVI